MPYLTIGVTLILLALLPLLERQRKRRPSKERAIAIHRQVEQEIAKGRWSEAQAALKPLIAGNQKSLYTYLLYLQILRNRKQFDRAEAELEQAFVRFPGNLRLYREQAHLLLDQGRKSEALAPLKSAGPVLRSEEDLLLLAEALLNAGEVEEAWAKIQDYTLESRNGRLLALAGDCHYMWKKYSLAVDYYLQSKHYGWLNSRTLTRTGHALRQVGRYQEAERYFRALLDRDPGDLQATLGLGLSLEAKGLYRRALLVYQCGQAWDEGHPLLLRQAGICCVHTGQLDYAELYLKQAIDGQASSPEALAFLGFALEKQRKWEEAEGVYVRLMEDYPDHPSGVRALAWLYGVGLSRSIGAEQGLALAHQALQMLPDATSWELLSACEARAGNWSRAHNIQEQLSVQASDRPTRLRRRAAMRSLRRRIPLDAQLVARSLVA